MVYPFAPAFARGLGVPVAAIYQLIVLRNFTGFLSPLFSPLSSKYGRRTVMAGAMFFFALGGFIVIIWPTYWMLGASLSAVAIAKVIYDPAMQSYVGDAVPYAKRGKALAVTELSWAGALLIGAPAVGLAMQQWGWNAPFFWLAIFGLGAAVSLWKLLPAAPTDHSQQGSSLSETWQIVRQHRVIWAAMGYIILSMMANEIVFLVFGDWLESNFGLSLLALGFSASLIGLAELSGEVTAGWSVDRFGKRPVIIATGLLNALFNLLLPFSGFNLTFVLITYFLLFLFFEITVVGGVPLMTELVPSARTVVMSSILGASALGRALGAWMGPFLLNRYSFVANGVVAGVLMITAVFILWRWVKEGKY